MKTVVEAGGYAIVQNPLGAFASAMPEAALVACPGTQVSSLNEIACVPPKRPLKTTGALFFDTPLNAVTLILQTASFFS